MREEPVVKRLSHRLNWLPLTLMALGMTALPALAHDSAPAAPSTIPDAVLRQIGLSNANCNPGKAAFSDDGKRLALNVDCGESRLGRRVWIIDLSSSTATPATPPLGASDPNGETIVQDGTEVRWSGDTLYVATSMETRAARKGDPAYWQERYFSARPGQAPKALRQQQMPGSVNANFEHPFGRFPVEEVLPDTDNNVVADGIFRIGKHLVWISSDANDRVTLRTRVGKGAIRDLASGGWELSSLQYDSRRLIYPSRNGIIVFDLDAGQPRRITVTHADARPVAWQPSRHSFAYTATRGCDGKAQPGNRVLCILVLP